MHPAIQGRRSGYTHGHPPSGKVFQLTRLALGLYGLMLEAGPRSKTGVEVLCPPTVLRNIWPGSDKWYLCRGIEL